MKIIILFCLIANTLFATNQKIEELLQKYHELGELNGVALVAGPQGIIIKKAFGFANFEWNIPNQIDTKFRIGSLTKQFTSSLILKLIEKGKLTEESVLSDLLPWYRKDTGSKVTLKQLLNHTSGINRFDIKGIFSDHGWKAIPLKEEVEKFCSGDLEWEPGSKFAYNNAGYLILGAIIEEVTGKSYTEVLKEEILIPLGMENTGMDDPYAVIKKRAGGYNKNGRGYVKPEFIHSFLAGSAGGLYSTIEDLYLWDQVLYSDKILSNESIKKLFTPGKENNGYGWFVFSEALGENGENKKLIRHPGQGDGFYSIFWRVPEDKYTIIIINNTGATNLPTIANGILDILYQRVGKISIASVVRNEIENNGLEAGLEKYKTLKKNQFDKYNFNEDELNTLGILMFRQKQYKEGLAMFELNTKMFPESPEAWNSLGQVYFRMGNKKKAIELYKKVIGLSPENKEANDMIKKLTKGNN